MGQKTSALIGAAAVLATGPAFATPQAIDGPAVPVAASYAELLQPIPNAVERLKMADGELAADPPPLVLAQDVAHHHHHHHHHHGRAWYRANGYVWLNGGWVLRPVRHHHHHHHHHHHDQ